MFAWLRDHPLADLSAQVVMVVLFAGVGYAILLGFFLGSLWGHRLWNGRREFVEREIPKSTRIKVAGTEVQFAEDVGRSLLELQATVAKLKSGMAQILNERKETTNV